MHHTSHVDTKSTHSYATPNHACHTDLHNGMKEAQDIHQGSEGCMLALGKHVLCDFAVALSHVEL
jgi:hypothetical protein